MTKALIIGALAVLPLAACASTLFADNFDNETPDSPKISFAQWDILSPSVDIHGYGSPWGNGQQKYETDRFVDLDGTSNPDSDGTIVTKDPIAVIAGTTYEISYDLNLNPGSPTPGDNGVRMEFGLLTQDDFVASPCTEWIHKSYTYVANNDDAATGLKLKFTGRGQQDWQGVFLDNVQVQSVPEPASLSVLGLGAVALLRRRSKR